MTRKHAGPATFEPGLNCADTETFRFAPLRVNGQCTATNIVEIAREPNIGLKSLVFLDDNPAERNLVRQRLPDVMTVELPRAPALCTWPVLEPDVLESLALTEEDQMRSQPYQEQQERKRFAESSVASGDLAAYSRGSQMTVQIAPAAPITLPSITRWEIDTFLQSWRVLGRGLEDALSTFLAVAGRDAGAKRLRGQYPDWLTVCVDGGTSGA